MPTILALAIVQWVQGTRHDFNSDQLVWFLSMLRLIRHGQRRSHRVSCATTPFLRVTGLSNALIAVWLVMSAPMLIDQELHVRRAVARVFGYEVWVTVAIEWHETHAGRGAAPTLVDEAENIYNKRLWMVH
jgi:hypothetical protein